MSQRRDLYVLVADEDQRRVVQTLLDKRRPALRIRPVDYEIKKHARRDPGVFEEGAIFLRYASREFSHAIVVLDAEFGRAPTSSASELKQKLEARIDAAGWDQPPLVVVIDPELEAWVWSDSAEVDRILGMRRAQIRALARQHDFWGSTDTKPRRPKELLELVVRRVKARGPAPTEYIGLAERVGLGRCIDPAFCELRDTLRQWFGSQPHGTAGSA